MVNGGIQNLDLANQAKTIYLAAGLARWLIPLLLGLTACATPQPRHFVVVIDKSPSWELQRVLRLSAQVLYSLPELARAGHDALDVILLCGTDVLHTRTGPMPGDSLELAREVDRDLRKPCTQPGSPITAGFQEGYALLQQGGRIGALVVITDGVYSNDPARVGELEAIARRMAEDSILRAVWVVGLKAQPGANWRTPLVKRLFSLVKAKKLLHSAADDTAGQWPIFTALVRKER